MALSSADKYRLKVLVGVSKNLKFAKKFFLCKNIQARKIKQLDDPEGYII